MYLHASYATVVESQVLTNYGARMVVTRKQQRRQAVTDEQNASPGVSDDSRSILGMGDRESLDQRPRDTLRLSRDWSNTRASRESVSWSMGDHQAIRNQSPT